MGSVEAKHRYQRIQTSQETKSVLRETVTRTDEKEQRPPKEEETNPKYSIKNITKNGNLIDGLPYKVRELLREGRIEVFSGHDKPKEVEGTWLLHEEEEESLGTIVQIYMIIEFDSAESFSYEGLLYFNVFRYKKKICVLKKGK